MEHIFGIFVSLPKSRVPNEIIIPNTNYRNFISYKTNKILILYAKCEFLYSQGTVASEIMSYF